MKRVGLANVERDTTMASESWQENNTKSDKPAKKRRRFRPFSFILMLFLIGIIAGFSNNFIPSESMEPNLKVGDHIATMRTWLAYPMGRMPSRGDIIIFHIPKEMDLSSMGQEEGNENSGSSDDNGSNNIATQLRDKLIERQKKGDLLIKRVIGLPGDTIVLKDKKVLVNGKKLEENYARFDAEDDGFARFATAENPLKVPQGELFVLGDNRKTSDDGRFWGTLKRENIAGKYLFVLYNEGSEGKNSKIADEERQKNNND